MPIRKTGSLPENIDRQVNEIIRAYREIEEKVNRLQNTLDSQIRSNVESIRQHTLNKSNPHFVTAQQIRALPLEFILDSSAVYFPFYQSLVSTRGIEPDGLQEAIKTEYGLVSGNNLCATLLPEGGVSVAEGTTNLVNNPTEWMVGASPSRQVVEDTGERYLGCKISKTTKIASDTPASQLCAISIADGETYTASIYQKCLYNAEEDFAGRLVFYNYATSQFLAQVETREVNKWERLKITYTNNTGATLNNVLVYYYPARTQGSITLTAAPQVEKKPYDTPFTDGTRAAGILPYHNLAPQLNQRQFTFTAWWRPYLELGTLNARIFQVEESPVIGRRIVLQRENTTQNLNLLLPNAAGNGNQVFTFIPSAAYAANTWHFVAVVVDVANMTARIHLNNEYEEFTLPETPAMLDLKRFYLGCVGATAQLNGDLRGVLLRPYAVSPETISTWHSLDVPFIDPFILPSQGVTQTPDDITIIETSENTEVV